VAGIEFSLAPNPAVSSVALRFALPHPGRARLEVFDLAGRRVATLLDRELAAGGHTLRWDGVSTRGDRVRSGVYAIRLTAAGATARRTLAWMP
jgi:flagellar hook assembly protein FlgD